MIGEARPAGGRVALARERFDAPLRILAPYLQAGPLAAILVFFLLIPMGALIVVSFFDYDSVQIIPSFQFTNYTDVLGSAVTWRTLTPTRCATP